MMERIFPADRRPGREQPDPAADAVAGPEL